MRQSDLRLSEDHLTVYVGLETGPAITCPAAFLSVSAPYITVPTGRFMVWTVLPAAPKFPIVVVWKTNGCCGGGGKIQNWMTTELPPPTGAPFHTALMPTLVEIIFPCGSTMLFGD
jgi:hypothetical protein